MSVSFTDRQASRWREKPGVLRPLGNRGDSTYKDITGGLLSLSLASVSVKERVSCPVRGWQKLSCFLFSSLKDSVHECVLEISLL